MVIAKARTKQSGCVWDDVAMPVFSLIATANLYRSHVNGKHRPANQLNRADCSCASQLMNYNICEILPCNIFLIYLSLIATISYLRSQVTRYIDSYY